MTGTPDKIDLLGIHIDNISKEEVLRCIADAITSNKKIVIANVNLHALNLGYTNPQFREFLNKSQIVFCDGFGVQLSAKLTGQKLDHRFTPPDWINELSNLANQNKWGIFLLGSQQDAVVRAAENIHKAHPDLKIDTHHGFFDQSNPENEDVVEQINESAAKILLAGMGMPLQEQWIAKNFSKLSGVNICMPVGALFDYLSGNIKRGPKFMTNHGMEWLARLLIEPKRLWRRYLLGIPQVLFRILRYHLLNKDHQT